MAEAQIWQWPLNTLNPANTDMYMFMVTQDLPGRGKRDLRAAVAWMSLLATLPIAFIVLVLRPVTRS